MSVHDQLDALVPVAVALLLSGLIGLDREWRHRPAGIRTHMLVGMGSALVISMASLQYGADSAARLAANVITGIGFLGAGVIVQHRDRVRDLTTAASLWMVAMIGLTAQSAPSQDELGRRLQGRVAAMARTHGLLTSERWRGASLIRIIRDELHPYAEGNDDSVVLSRPRSLG